jgi:hypothetical protein
MNRRLKMGTVIWALGMVAMARFVRSRREQMQQEGKDCCICDPNKSFNPNVCLFHKKAGKTHAEQHGISIGQALGKLYLAAKDLREKDLREMMPVTNWESRRAMDTTKLVVGQEVDLVSGCYGRVGRVVSVTPSGVEVQTSDELLHFDDNGRSYVTELPSSYDSAAHPLSPWGWNGNGTYECGPWYIEQIASVPL